MPQRVSLDALPDSTVNPPISGQSDPTRTRNSPINLADSTHTIEFVNPRRQATDSRGPKKRATAAFAPFFPGRRQDTYTWGVPGDPRSYSLLLYSYTRQV